MGIKKRSPAKKGSGASRGGIISKKERSTFELVGASVTASEEGKGYSTNAARELQASKKN